MMRKAKVEEPAVSVDGLKVSTFMLAGAALILFAFSGYMWIRFVRGGDRHVFWDAIANSLSTEGVEIVADDSDGELVRKVTTTYDMFGELSVESRSEFKDADTHSIIRTVSTKERDFLYYEKNENQKEPRLKEFEGLWVDIGTEGQTESRTLTDQYVNGALVLVGNLSSSNRKKIIKQMQDNEAYTIEGFLGTQQIAGRSARLYRVRINAIAYNTALKSYLEAMGLPEAAAQIGDTASEDLQPVVEIAVDANERRIVATGYPELTSTGAREYYNWDTKHEFALPDNALSADELQKRLDTIYTPTTN